MLAAIVSTPLILRFLGSERFGAFRVLLDWLGNLALLDFGVSGSLAARLAPHTASGSRTGTAAILAAGLRTQLKITVAMLVAGVALVAAAPYLVPTSEVSTRELRLCTCLLLIPALWTPLTVFRALIEVRQQSYAINFLLILQTLLSTALLAAAAWAGWGLVGQGAAMAIASVPLMVVLLSHGCVSFGTFSLLSLQKQRSLRFDH